MYKTFEEWQAYTGRAGKRGSVAGSLRNDSAFRVCIASQRQLSRQLSRCCGFEFEDVIAEIENADMVLPQHSGLSPLCLKLRHGLAPYTGLSRSVPSLVSVEPPTRHYDIFFMLVQFPRDLDVYDALREYRDRSRVAICYLEEIWKKSIDHLGHLRNILQEFDAVFVNCAGSAERLAEVIQRPVHYVPPGVDALRFCPAPDQNRCIDVVNIGRKSPVTHEALLKMSMQDGCFYVFDSLQGPFKAKVPWQHRLVLANHVKHSRYFIANAAKMDRVFETESQPEIGFRFFEGLAGGAVLLGDHPQTEQFQEHLGWPDSVIRIPYDCKNVAEVIADLEGQTERIDSLRRRNVMEILSRHDWLHRWRKVLSVANSPEGEGMAARAAALEERSQQHARCQTD